jgi:hypothetical protein
MLFVHKLFVLIFRTATFIKNLPFKGALISSETPEKTPLYETIVNWVPGSPID